MDDAATAPLGGVHVKVAAVAAAAAGAKAVHEACAVAAAGPDWLGAFSNTPAIRPSAELALLPSLLPYLPR